MGASKYQFISRVEHDIIFNTRNKSGISAHPCIILYIVIRSSYTK